MMPSALLGCGQVTLLNQQGVTDGIVCTEGQSSVRGRGKGAEQHKHFSSQVHQQQKGKKMRFSFSWSSFVFRYYCDLQNHCSMIYKMTVVGAGFGDEKPSSPFRV